MDEYLEQVSAALEIPIDALKKQMAFRPGIYLRFLHDNDRKNGIQAPSFQDGFSHLHRGF